MGEAASPLRASKDPTSSGLLQWRWPGTTVPMGAAPMRCIGAEGNRDTAFSTGWGVRTPPLPPPVPHLTHLLLLPAGGRQGKAGGS